MRLKYSDAARGAAGVDFSMIEVLRAEVVHLARELDRVYLRNGRRNVKADALAREAILRLLMELSALEDDTDDMTPAQSASAVDASADLVP